MHVKLGELTLYVDEDEILRVGGRLKSANIPFDVKHPMLITSSHPLAKTIAEHFHHASQHQHEFISHGVIRQERYHIENGRELIRKIIH